MHYYEDMPDEYDDYYEMASPPGGGGVWVIQGKIVKMTTEFLDSLPSTSGGVHPQIGDVTKSNLSRTHYFPKSDL
jgi:hypothetical protein